MSWLVYWQDDLKSTTSGWCLEMGSKPFSCLTCIALQAQRHEKATFTEYTRTGVRLYIIDRDGLISVQTLICIEMSKSKMTCIMIFQIQKMFEWKETLLGDFKPQEQCLAICFGCWQPCLLVQGSSYARKLKYSRLETSEMIGLKIIPWIQVRWDHPWPSF